MLTTIGKFQGSNGEERMKILACNSTKQKLTTMIFGITLLLLSVANVSFAKDVTLTWDANQEADLAGYKIHYGTSSGTYTGTEANTGPSPIDFGNTTSATFVGLDDTKSHYFTVTAYNVYGEESAYAYEVNAPVQSNDDSDGDGYAYSVDCDDYNAAINPGAVENCFDGVDNNCNRLIDAADSTASSCPVTTPMSEPFGVYRGGAWFIDNNGNGAWDTGTDTTYASFGGAGDLPVIGDWNGDRTPQIGVFRNGAWYLDANGNGGWDQGTDTVYASFGAPSDQPVIGVWR
jgi:hypothetical protein